MAARPRGTARAGGIPGNDLSRAGSADVYKRQVKDLLSSPEIENILENSDFICLLNQASGDRKILAERDVYKRQPYRSTQNAIAQCYKMAQLQNLHFVVEDVYKRQGPARGACAWPGTIHTARGCLRPG